MDIALETPVLIAGGGPVGMTLALHLAHYGVRSILVERNPTTTRHPKMDLTNGRSMELFKRLGLADRLRDAGVPQQNPFDVSWVTSMAGYELHRFRYPSADESREIILKKNDGSQASEPGLRVSQVMIEPVLKKAVDAHELIDVRFGTRFERLIKQDAHHVDAEIVEVETGASRLVRCQYLAGCDGGGSRVRRQLGIELDGDMAVAGAYMVHFRTQAKDLLQRWGIAWHYQSGAGTIIAQNDDDIYTLQAWLLPGQDPAAMRPQDVLEGWVGKKFEYEILQANPWTANFVVAQRYVKGRVVLAGDSAHQYIPTGGYGMNSGVADAAGLSWVLAALVQGWGGKNLLDAYEKERKPTAWWHLEAARRHMGVRIAIGEVYAEAGDLEAPGAETEAKRMAVAAKIALLGNAENESWGVELGYRYDESPIIFTDPNPPAIDPIEYRASTSPGLRLPHLFLDDGSAVHEKLGLFYTLLAFTEFDSAPIERIAADLSIPLKIVQLQQRDLIKIYERNFLLVRPDQHIAWRDDRLPADFAQVLKHVTGH
jgi:2-polyprenyl-6-methoxyphenol hydroxylase-like FAD-dependent oxidoreductase